MAKLLCIFFILLISLSDHLVQSAKPVLNRLISSATQAEGSNYVLFCSISTGSMPIRFAWSFNSKPLQRSSEFSIESTEMLSLLKISSVQRSHAGNYTCLAENAEGTDNIWLMLKVEGKVS